METIAVKTEFNYEDDFDEHFFTEEEMKVRLKLCYSLLYYNITS